MLWFACLSSWQSMGEGRRCLGERGWKWNTNRSGLSLGLVQCWTGVFFLSLKAKLLYKCYVNVSVNVCFGDEKEALLEAIGRNKGSLIWKIGENMKNESVLNQESAHTGYVHM